MKKLFKNVAKLLKEEKYEEAAETLASSHDWFTMIHGLLNGEENELSGNEVELVKLLQTIYNESESEAIPDTLYDLLYEVINNKGIDVVGTQKASSNREVYKHKYPELRGTLDKVHGIDKTPRTGLKTFFKWLTNVENTLGRPLKDYELSVRLYPKWDGVSAVYEEGPNGTERVLKRGYTNNNEAENIPLFEQYGGPDKKLVELRPPYGVKTEIIMTKGAFAQFREKYGEFKSPRSAISSIINSDDMTKEVMQYVSIIPLEVYKDGESYYDIQSVNCELSKHVSNCKDVEKMNEAIHEIQERINDIGAPIDGIVIRLESDILRKELGRKDSINKFEVAYKLPPAMQMSKVVDVHFSQGLNGEITPVLEIEPVVMEGNTVKNVSLGSYGRFKALGLKHDDVAVVSYNIIPHLERIVHGEGEVIKGITECPSCGHALMIDNRAHCLNYECSNQVRGRILRYIQKMRIEGISYSTVDDLVRIGYLSNIVDLYKLKDYKKELADMEGYGEKRINAILNSIEERSVVEPSVFLGSLSIRDIGRKIFGKVLTVYSYETLMNNLDSDMIQRLTMIDGIGDKTASEIVAGLKQDESMIRKLEKHITFVKEESKEYAFSVCFTKVRDKEFEKFLDEHSVKVSDYRKGITYLIVPDLNVSSSKVTKAKKDGVKVITIDDAYQLFQYKK